LDEAVVAFETMRKMIDGRPSGTMCNILIHGFVKCGQYENTLKVYDEMIKGRVKQDVYGAQHLVLNV
jgi:pentatricopeptide repeat protein